MNRGWVLVGVLTAVVGLGVLAFVAGSLLGGRLPMDLLSPEVDLAFKAFVAAFFWFAAWKERRGRSARLLVVGSTLASILLLLAVYRYVTGP